MYSSNINIISVNKENANSNNNENVSENSSDIGKIEQKNLKNHNQSQRIIKNSITQHTCKKRNISNNINSHNNYSNRKKFHNNSNNNINNNNNSTKILNNYPTKNILHNIVNIKKNSTSYINKGTNIIKSNNYSGRSIKSTSPPQLKNSLKFNNIKINNNNNNKNINNCNNINTNSSLNNNIIPKLEVSMVMNSTPSITDQNTTTVNATNSTSTIVPTSVSPAASYSLDFLHSVGVQMTIGGSSCSSSRGFTPTPSPSPPAPRNPTSYLNATNLRNRYSYTMQEDVNMPSVDNQTLNTNKDFNNYDTFDHLNGRLPSSSTSSTIRSNTNIGTPILTSRGLTYNPHQLYQNNNYSHTHQHPHHHQQQQQQQQNQYYLNHQQQNHPPQYQSINSALHYNNNNRNNHQHHLAKKSQNTFNNNQNNNNIKKTYSNNNTTKYVNNLTTSINDINNNSSQTLQRTRNHQNFNNLTYVLTDTGKFVNNSRSPTPSPKSESPLIFRQQNLNENISSNSAGIIASPVNYDLLENSSISAASGTVEKSPHGVSFVGASTNDYESDSSHSSYRNNEKALLSNNNINPNSNNNHNSNNLNYNSNNMNNNIISNNINNNNNNLNNNIPNINNNNSSNNNNSNNINNNNNRQILGAGSYHLGEINSIISFSPAYSEEDIFKTHGNYYGSHQNLTYWNVGLNPPFSPYGVYSPNNISATEINNQYVNDAGTSLSNTKRSQSAQRGTFRGRRHLFPSFRAHSFHENIYTPPDKFLARAHLIEIKEAPPNLLNGTKWDSLTQDIWNKFIASQQTEETYKKKMYLWRYLYVTIKKAYPRYGLYLVGSTISGFGADTSDVDMCLVSRNATSIDPRMEALFNLTLLKEYLGTLGVFENFNLIEAKVPILRFRDSMHMLEVDLNFNNCVGIRNTHLLHCYSQLDWRLKPLVLITKLWAQFHNINNAKNMTISSYSLVLMVIHFLQFAISPPVLPCLHEMFPEKFQIILKSNDFGFVDMNEDIGHYESQNNQTLGELLLLYLEYYSNFDFAQYAISVRTGAVLPIDVCRQAKSLKNDIHQWKELCIEEPFDLTNTARSVYDFDTFERIKAVFLASWKVLHESLDMSSIFSPIVQTAIPHTPLSMTPPIS